MAERLGETTLHYMPSTTCVGFPFGGLVPSDHKGARLDLPGRAADVQRLYGTLISTMRALPFVSMTLLAAGENAPLGRSFSRPKKLSAGSRVAFRTPTGYSGAVDDSRDLVGALPGRRELLPLDTSRRVPRKSRKPSPLQNPCHLHLRGSVAGLSSRSTISGRPALGLHFPPPGGYRFSRWPARAPC